ncbi:hypothetical protein F0562_023179 [Nyssa sinensis]|uniref:Uncharacterized protein n=1 Tax=Nyssa sinensis TaxID=561372 RepID=A0A5J5BJM9_9ASTE|nr:hypothetical protein F0562_023179 [Nyssa sinensis]
MAAAVGRGAQTMNSMGIKPMLRKAYHRKSSSPDIGDTFKLNGEEVKNKGIAGDRDNSWWVPDDRTGIYYPKGQEKIMVDVPPGAGKDFGVNWFSNNDF